ncbi:MAG: GAF domain-containing protein, partial [Nostoc sp.]
VFSSVLAIRVHDHCFGENYSSLYALGRSYVVDDIYNGGMTNCHTDILAQFQVRANLIMPFLCGNKLWGLLCIHQCATTRHWQQSEIDFTLQLANQLAIAIQQANLYEQIQSELLVRQQAEARIALELRRQHALGAIIQKIRQSLDINEILATVTQQVNDVMHSDRVIV